MNKKNIATTLVLLLCSCLFAVTGSTFMNLLYQKNKIIVENPKVVSSSGVLVYASSNDNKTQLTEIKFNDMSLGLKPVTGEADQETNIPSTVINKSGTEGLYAEVKVTAPAGLKIQVTNIVVTSNQDAEKVEAERKNMWVALKEVKNSANTLEDNTIALISLDESVEDKEFIIFFWLDGKTSNNLKGAKISFEMHFIV